MGKKAVRKGGESYEEKVKRVAKELGIKFSEDDAGSLIDRIVERLTGKTAGITDKKVTANFLSAHGVDVVKYEKKLKEYQTKRKEIKEEYLVAYIKSRIETSSLNREFLFSIEELFES